MGPVGCLVCQYSRTFATGQIATDRVRRLGVLPACRTRFRAIPLRERGRPAISRRNRRPPQFAVVRDSDLTSSNASVRVCACRVRFESPYVPAFMQVSVHQFSSLRAWACCGRSTVRRTAANLVFGLPAASDHAHRGLGHWLRYLGACVQMAGPRS